MYAATAAFIRPTTRKSCGSVRPARSRPIAISAATIMKSAFMMLFAAMMRARCVGCARLWISA